MYKIKDNVNYYGFKCFIGQVLGDDRYTVVAHNKDFVIEAYGKDLEPIDNDIPPTCDRYEVRHVIYDTKDSEIVNDDCYITLAEARKVCDEMNAPKVMKPKYTKEVDYFGMKLLVPDDAKIIVTHKDGGIFVSNENCCLASTGWLTGGYLKHICNVDLNGIDWKETLVEIK